jgi:hypothetical protein
MRISWFDDAWRSKTEQTAERLLLDTLHAQGSSCDIETIGESEREREKPEKSANV